MLQDIECRPFRRQQLPGIAGNFQDYAARHHVQSVTCNHLDLCQRIACLDDFHGNEHARDHDIFPRDHGGGQLLIGRNSGKAGQITASDVFIQSGFDKLAQLFLKKRAVCRHINKPDLMWVVCSVPWEATFPASGQGGL